MSLIVVTGLAAEARIAVVGDAAIVGAGRAQWLAEELDAAIAAAGARRLLELWHRRRALVPQLRPGDLIVAHGVRDAKGVFNCDPDWRSAIERRLQRQFWSDDDAETDASSASNT